MESNHTMSYDVDKSSERMDEILNASDNDYCDKDSIPARSDLTFKNGYYVGGAIWTDDFAATNYISNNKEDLLKLRNTKYIQSDSQGFYKQVKELLKA